jgi:hypothetical protein
MSGHRNNPRNQIAKDEEGIYDCSHLLHFGVFKKYRLKLRGYDLDTVERILRHSSERYVDTVSGRLVAIGRHAKLLVMIPV